MKFNFCVIFLSYPLKININLIYLKLYVNDLFAFFLCIFEKLKKKKKEKKH